MASGTCNNSISATAPNPVKLAVNPSAAKKPSYGEILNSSALIGASSILNIAIGAVRTKAMAVILGPAGFGLAGIYGSIADLAQAFAGMGINSSGVRQIAAAASPDNTERLGFTIAVLRRTSIVLGLLGALVLVLFSRQVSAFTFGNNQHSVAVCLLGVAVFFRLVSAGQAALIQGMRRIADLAKMGVLGALFATFISIPVVYAFREKGVAPSLVGIAGMTIITSWWYSRKIQIRTPSMAVPQMAKEAAALFKLGCAFMVSGLMTLGIAYGVRIIVLHKVGFTATGFYQSAWTLGGLYVGFILQAMGADFYPRLTASASDNAECNRLVNEQTLAGLLLAGPGVIATLTFAPLVIALFYTAKFGAAVELLRWICLGTTLQVITWPMGFIIIAKGKQNLFIFSEAAWAAVSVGLAWAFVSWFGTTGAGIAFFGSYVFHGILTYAIVSRLSGFRWSQESVHTGLLFLSIIGAVFCVLHELPLLVAQCVGSFAIAATGVYSVRTLQTVLSIDDLPRPLQRLIAVFTSSS